jgi:hypothetical protein
MLFFPQGLQKGRRKGDELHGIKQMADPPIVSFSALTICATLASVQ